MLHSPDSAGQFPTSCPIVEDYMRENGVWAALESDQKHEFICHRFVKGGAQRPAYLVQLEHQWVPSFNMVPHHPANPFAKGGMQIQGLSTNWTIEPVASTRVRSYFDPERIRHLAEFRGWYIHTQEQWICLRPPMTWEIPSPDQIVNLMERARALVEVLLMGP